MRHQGKRRRPRPLRLHEKLLQIRQAYGLSQSELVNRLGLIQELNPSDISAFERDPNNKWSREPSLPHLLRYARMAGLNVEVLIDDELELPDKLATDPLHGVVRRLPKKARKASSGVKKR
jgi:transcriptional regulator with XRE-family HTH domain